MYENDVTRKKLPSCWWRAPQHEQAFCIGDTYVDPTCCESAIQSNESSSLLTIHACRPIQNQHCERLPRHSTNGTNSTTARKTGMIQRKIMVNFLSASKKTVHSEKLFCQHRNRFILNTDRQGFDSATVFY